MSPGDPLLLSRAAALRCQGHVYGNPVLRHRLSKTFTRFMFMEILIKRNALLSALAGAKAAYPREFICLLRGRRDSNTNIVIEDTLIPPGIMVSQTMSSFSDWMMPFIEGLMGTFHSHPGGSCYPSRQDLYLFSKKGGVHLVAAEPFDEKSVSCYLGDGKKAAFRAID